MARDITSKYKRSRREGIELFPDLDRAGTPKSPLTRRHYAPGAHGSKKSWNKVSNYGQQLREKQKAKRIYGILERQFANYYAKAIKKEGDTGEVMLALLERRLDNVVYRLGLAKTRASSRQLVTHGNVQVNGQKVNIPSFQVKVGQAIAVREGLARRDWYMAFLQGSKRSSPGWLVREGAGGKVVAEPDLEEAKTMVDMRPIIEFYSR